MTDEAPDAVGVVYGWRFWRSCDDAELHSIATEVKWPAGKAARAVCLRSSPFVNPEGVHDAPAEDCLCGLYAKRLLADVIAEYDVDDGAFATAVLGEVKLWGAYFEGPRGYRAEYAYPSRLWVLEPAWNDRMAVAQPMLARVGRMAVAVELARRWRVPCRVATLAEIAEEVGEPQESRDRPSVAQWAAMDHDTRQKVRSGLGALRSGTFMVGGAVPTTTAPARAMLARPTTAPLGASLVVPRFTAWKPVAAASPPPKPKPLRLTLERFGIGWFVVASLTELWSTLPWYTAALFGPLALVFLILAMDQTLELCRIAHVAGWFVAVRDEGRWGFGFGRDGWPPRWYVRVGFGEGVRFKVRRWTR